MKRILISSAAACLCALACAGADEAAAVRSWKFDFTSAKPATGVVSVAATNVYSRAAGFGFDLGSGVARGAFFFSIALPEGNYAVTATFGDVSAATTNTVKAEARRLMLENVTTARGETATRRFTVNTRTADFPGGNVHLKPRERTNEAITWDEKLTLEFNGSRPALRTLEIAPVTDATTVFITGDSTVCDQPVEPWNSWGQMLPRFFNDRVAVANYAESGESIRTSLASHRFDKLFSRIQPGDFLFVQFGHNDQKDNSTNALATYKANLKKIIAITRAKGATPVLITSMERKSGVNTNTLAGYPATVRDVAREDSVALIDLNEASQKLYRALGADLGLAFQDGTHHNNYGSYELARCVVEGIRSANLSLSKLLAADATPFDPAKPDAVKNFHMAASRLRNNAKPDGN